MSSTYKDVKEGAQGQDINNIFVKCARQIEAKSICTTKRSTKRVSFDNRLFFHYQYHLRDVSRQRIRNIYENICKALDERGQSFKSMKIAGGNKLCIYRLTVCYSRPKNLHDKLVPSKLYETPKIVTSKKYSIPYRCSTVK